MYMYSQMQGYYGTNSYLLYISDPLTHQFTLWLYVLTKFTSAEKFLLCLCSLRAFVAFSSACCKPVSSGLNDKPAWKTTK